MHNTATVGDLCTHNAKLVNGSSKRFAGGRAVVRLGDLVDCPQHGPNKVVEVIAGMPFTDGLPTAHATAKSECGAEILPNVYQSPTGGVDAGEAFSMETEDMNDADKKAYLTDKFGGGAGGAAAADSFMRSQAASTYDGPVEAIKAPDTKSTQVGCENIINGTADSFKLSASYTVGSLSSAIYQAANAHAIPETTAKGMSRADVICNLKHLAINSIEPAKAKLAALGFEVRIGSGFRNATNGSDHNIGSAADLHIFKNGDRVSRADLNTCARALIATIPFTQMILEFSGSGSAGWIHVANRKNGVNSAERICFTFSGGSPYTAGLPSL